MRVDIISGNLRKAILCPEMDSELGIQFRMLGFLECFLADTQGPGALYSSLPRGLGRSGVVEKNGIL